MNNSTWQVVCIVCMVMTVSGCGGGAAQAPPVPAYPVLHHGSSIDTMTHLDKGILLHYSGEPEPTVKEFIVSGDKSGRGSSCVNASINVLEAMQADAKKIGANAIINLRASWEGMDRYDEAGPTFDCQPGFGGATWGIQWTGDFVIVEGVTAEPTEPPPPAGVTPAGETPPE